MTRKQLTIIVVAIITAGVLAGGPYAFAQWRHHVNEREALESNARIREAIGAPTPSSKPPVVRAWRIELDGTGDAAYNYTAGDQKDRDLEADLPFGASGLAEEPLTVSALVFGADSAASCRIFIDNEIRDEQHGTDSADCMVQIGYGD